MAADHFADYVRYWGLSKPPFSLAPSRENLYLSRQHGECLLRLKYAVLAGKGGALLISQNAGDGKTSILRRLCRDLEHELDEPVRIAFIDHPTLTPVQMLQEISRQLGVERPYRTKVRALSALQEHLAAVHQAGERCVVIVDEGQMLVHRPDLLQELRILLNFCVGESFLLSFVLSGQLPLENVIRSMPEFWQRLPVRFFLGNLDLGDTRKLIEHRLHCAGLEPGRAIFSPKAFEQLYALSEGCPRVICALADLALVVGRSAGVRAIDSPQIAQAHADMEKRSSESFHYYHFLQTGPPGPGRPAPEATPPPPEDQPLRVIPVDEKRSSRSRMRSWFRTPRP